MAIYKGKYFYRVSEFLSYSKGKERFDYVQDFEGADFAELRKAAFAYLQERKQGIEKLDNFQGVKLIPENEQKENKDNAVFGLRLDFIYSHYNDDKNIRPIGKYENRFTIYSFGEKETYLDLDGEQLIYKEILNLPEPPPLINQ